MGVVRGLASARAPSPRCRTSVSARFDMVPSGPAPDHLAGIAGGHDRLDELAIRILIALLYQFAHRAPAIGRLVVRRTEVERADGVVIGPDDEDAGEPGGRDHRGVT